MKNDPIKHQLFIVIIGCLLFISFIGNVHLFDWDEINFAEAAREMMLTNDFLTVRIDYHAFHEKPPLFIWFEVFSMKIFGINEFAARLPNSIIGIITLLFLYNIGKSISNSRFAILWVVVYAGSFLPHFYFKTVIIDPLFNLFMFAGVYYIYNFYNNNKFRNIIYASVLVSLAVMTKGPVGYLLPTCAWLVFIALNYKKYPIPFGQFIIYSIISFVPISFWYLAIFMQSNSVVLSDFIMYQIRLLTTSDAGHSGPFYYHFIILLLGCFPASVFVWNSFRNKAEESISYNNFRILNIILLCVVLVIFSIVKTKIVHYSSLAYFPITYLASLTIYDLIYGSKRLHWSAIGFISLVGLIVSLLLFWFPIVMMNIDKFIPEIDDLLTKEVLMSNVQWGGYEWIIGLIYFICLVISIFYIIQKKYKIGINILFINTIICLFLILPILAPKIEQYTQNAPIEFYKTFVGKDVYVQSIGFKSYAPFFYAQKLPKNSSINFNLSTKEFEEYLLTQKLDKDAYMVAQVDRANEILEQYPNLLFIKKKNGFVFFYRKANDI